MNKYEIMRRIVCGLMVWNLILTAGFVTYLWQENKQVTQDEKICNLEMIPLEPLEGDNYVD